MTYTSIQSKVYQEMVSSALNVCIMVKKGYFRLYEKIHMLVSYPIKPYLGIKRVEG